MKVNVKDYNTFEQLTEGIQKLNEKWKESNPTRDEDLTFAGIQRKMQNHRIFLTNERNELEGELNKLKDVWSSKVIAENRAKLNKAFDEMVQTVIEATRQDIAELSSAKMEKIGDMLATAPTDEQLRLLKALEMRGDVDSLEVHHILPVFFTNYQSMRVLKAVSEANGVTLNLPVQLDCRTMFDTLKEATDYLLGACNELGKEWKNIHISYHAFYTLNDKDPDKQYDPKYQTYIDMFDNTPQLQECKTEKKHLSRAEQAKVDWLFRDVASLDPANSGDYTVILNHVETIVKEHPEMVDVLRLSQYKAFVAKVDPIEDKE